MERIAHNKAGKFKELASDSSGGFAVTFAVAAVLLAGAAGFGIDLARISSVRSSVQQSLDAAVLAGVAYSPSAKSMSGVSGYGVTNADRIKTAVKYFESDTDNMAAVAAKSFVFEGDVLVGRATARVETTLLAVLGPKFADLEQIAKATSGPFRAPACFLAMHPLRKHTLELKDSVSVIAPDCHIYGNSRHPDDVVDPHTLENFLVGKSVQAVGYGHHFLTNVTPPVEHAPELIPDPLADLVIPAAGACQFTDTKITGGDHTLYPGVYCGGLTVESGAVVTLKPGLYNLTGGDFEVKDATVKGDGVTVSFATPDVHVNWTGATIRISAPKSGLYAGMAVIGSRDPADHTIDASTVDVHGVIYLLQGAFTWTNAGTPAVSALWTAWIVDGISWLGEGTINIGFNLKDSDIPYPKALYVIPRPGTQRLVQ
jgi:Putative Flp pilus-assembly TadE/G-like